MRSNGYDPAAYRAARQHVEQWRRLYAMRGSLAAMRVAMLIAALAKGNGAAVTCCPSESALSELARLSVRSVSRQIKTLVELGWLERVGPRAHTGTARTYRLRVPQPLHEVGLVEIAGAMRKGMWKELRECTTRHGVHFSKEHATVGKRARHRWSKSTPRGVVPY